MLSDPPPPKTLPPSCQQRGRGHWQPGGERLEGRPPLLEAQEPVWPVPPSFFLPGTGHAVVGRPFLRLVPGEEVRGAERSALLWAPEPQGCGWVSPSPALPNLPGWRAQGREVGGEEGGPLQSRSEESPVPAASSWAQLAAEAPLPGLAAWPRALPLGSSVGNTVWLLL